MIITHAICLLTCLYPCFFAQKMKTKIIYATVLVTFLCACATMTSIHLSCNEQHVEIYVDDEYVGRGLVNYTVPKGKDYIQVSCRENGIEIYSRKLYVKGSKNGLFELTIPKDYRYSSDY